MRHVLSRGPWAVKSACEAGLTAHAWRPAEDCAATPVKCARRETDERQTTPPRPSRHRARTPPRHSGRDSARAYPLDVLHGDRVLLDAEELGVGVDHGLRLALHLELALVEPDGLVGEVGDGAEGVADEDDRPVRGAELAHL